jgi:hypothetical protein
MAPEADTLIAGEAGYGTVEPSTAADTHSRHNPALKAGLALLLAPIVVVVMVVVNRAPVGGEAPDTVIDRSYAVGPPGSSSYSDKRYIDALDNTLNQREDKVPLTFRLGSKANPDEWHIDQPDQTWRNGYMWAQGPLPDSPDGYGSCIPACGRSVQPLNIVCIRSDSTIADNEKCEGKAPPDPLKECYDFSLCTPCWDVQPWQGCGQGKDCCGKCDKTRSVTCRFCERPSAGSAANPTILQVAQGGWTLVDGVAQPSKIIKVGFDPDNYPEGCADYPDQCEQLHSNEDICRLGKVGICNSEKDDRAEPAMANPDVKRHVDHMLLSDEQLRKMTDLVIDAPFDCTLMGNSVPVEGSDVWESGATTVADHPSYPNTEYVHIGPYDSVNLEPKARDECVNFCGCAYEWKYGDYENANGGMCHISEWTDPELGFTQDGCVEEIQGPNVLLSSPFEQYALEAQPYLNASASVHSCGSGMTRRWSRCCRKIDVGRCATDPTRRCVASGAVFVGPLSDGNHGNEFGGPTDVMCPEVKLGEVDTKSMATGEWITVPVIGRDACEQVQEIWECDMGKTGELPWPTLDDKPAPITDGEGGETVLLDAILTWIEDADGKCPGEGIKNNKCTFAEKEDTCEACEGPTCAPCEWQCAGFAEEDGWCNHAMNTTIDSIDAIDAACFNSPGPEECPARCGTVAYQMRQCWCRCYEDADSNNEPDSYEPVFPDSTVTFYNAVPDGGIVPGIYWNESVTGFPCSEALLEVEKPQIYRDCVGENCKAHWCVVEDFGICGGDSGWCGWYPQERDVNCCRSDGQELDRVHCMEDPDPHWELIMKIGADNEFRFDSVYWENDEELNELEPQAQNRKLNAYSDKKFDQIRMCFGNAFELLNPSFEDTVVGEEPADGAPSGWTLNGAGASTVRPGVGMVAADGDQYAVVEATTTISTSLQNLVPGQLTILTLSVASDDDDSLATLSVKINGEVIFSEEQGAGALTAKSATFTPATSVVTLGIMNAAATGGGDLLVDDLRVTSDGWMLVAQELAADDTFGLRFLGERNLPAAGDDGLVVLADPIFGGNAGVSGNIAPDLRFGVDYDEVMISYGDRLDNDVGTTYYKFAPSSGIFTRTVDMNITIERLSSNDGDLMSWVQAAGGAEFCKAAALNASALPGETSWGILPATDDNRGCGCTGQGFVGSGAYYAGTGESLGTDGTTYTALCTAGCGDADGTTSGCYTGGFTGSADTGVAKGYTQAAYDANPTIANRKLLQIFARPTSEHVGSMDDSNLNCIVYSFGSPLGITLFKSARDLFRFGEISVGPQAPSEAQRFNHTLWDNIFAEESRTVPCGMGNPGFNVMAGEPDVHFKKDSEKTFRQWYHRMNRARWGFFNNKPEDNCEDVEGDETDDWDPESDYDAAVGMGIDGQMDNDVAPSTEKEYGAGTGWTHLFRSNEVKADSKKLKKSWLWVADTTQRRMVPGMEIYELNADMTDMNAVVFDGYENLRMEGETPEEEQKPATTLFECQQRCLNIESCVVGVWLNGDVQFGECWLASAFSNETTPGAASRRTGNTEWCGAAEGQSCISFKKIAKLDQRTCSGILASDDAGMYVQVPGGADHDLNYLFPTGTVVTLLINGSATAPAWTYAHMARNLSGTVVSPLRVTKLSSETSTVVGAYTKVYLDVHIDSVQRMQSAWPAMPASELPVAGSGVCVYTLRSETAPMVRWPGKIVNCTHRANIKYMSEHSCADACEADATCDGYTQWQSKSADNKENMIQNHDFEQDFDGSEHTYSAGTAAASLGWQVTKGSVKVIAADDDTWSDVPSMEQVIDLNGNEPGAISQVVVSRPGQKYVLGFWAAGDFECSDDADNSLQKSVNVYWSGCVDVGDGNCFAGGDESTDLFSNAPENRVAAISLFTGAETETNMRWKQYFFEVTATEERSRLTFESTSAGGCGVLLDAVSLSLAAPIDAECALMGSDMAVEAIEEQTVIDSFCYSSDGGAWATYMLDEAVEGSDEDKAANTFGGWLLQTAGQSTTEQTDDCYDVVWGGVADRYASLPDGLLNCGQVPNDPQTTNTIGPFTGDRTWFRGVQAGGAFVTYTYRLTFTQPATILNVKIIGTNFDRAEWKLTNDKLIVLSERRFNTITPGEGMYSVVSSDDYHSVDCDDCSSCTVILPGAPAALESVYYLAEASNDATGKMREKICVRTPTCYLHSQDQYAEVKPNGLPYAGGAVACTDGLAAHVDLRDDTHASMLMQDKCSLVSTDGDRQYYGLSKPLGRDRAVTFAIKGTESDVRVAMFTYQQPPLQSADVGQEKVALTKAPLYQIIYDQDSVSMIRKGMNMEDKAINDDTVGLLAVNEWKWYWADARWVGDSFLVRAGRSDVVGNDVLLQWEDPSPLRVSHVAVSSWDTAAEWKVCSSRLAGAPYTKRVCWDEVCLCEWDAGEFEEPCSEVCGEGTKTRAVHCKINQCEDNSAHCTVAGKTCPKQIPVPNPDCIVKLYEHHAHGYIKDSQTAPEGWEISFGSDDKKNLPRDKVNLVNSLVIEGKRCAVILYDGDNHGGESLSLKVPEGEKSAIWTTGGDRGTQFFPSAFANRVNSLWVVAENDKMCKMQNKPATSISCYSERGCCYVYARTPWGDCSCDTCVEDEEECKRGENGCQSRDVQCEYRKMVCNLWDGEPGAEGSRCLDLQTSKYMGKATRDQCEKPSNEIQLQEGCPPVVEKCDSGNEGDRSCAATLMAASADSDRSKDADEDRPVLPSEFGSIEDADEIVCTGTGVPSQCTAKENPAEGQDCVSGKSLSPLDGTQTNMRRTCTDQKCFTCSWEAPRWEDFKRDNCKACGDFEMDRTRFVTCKRCDGERIDCSASVLNTYGKCCYSPEYKTGCGGCSQSDRPEPTQHCVDFSRCTYEWHVKTGDDKCDAFTECVSFDQWSLDDRSQGNAYEQREWCEQGPEDQHNAPGGGPDRFALGNFATYGLGACWAGIWDQQSESFTQQGAGGLPVWGVDKVLGNNGWTQPCSCYKGNMARAEQQPFLTNPDFGEPHLGTSYMDALANTVYLEQFEVEASCDDPSECVESYPAMRVHAVNVDLKGPTKVKGFIYQNNMGQPGQRLAVTEVVNAPDERGFVEMKFVSAANVAAGIDEGDESPDGSFTDGADVGAQRGIYLAGGVYWLGFQVSKDSETHVHHRSSATDKKRTILSKSDPFFDTYRSPHGDYAQGAQSTTTDGGLSIWADYSIVRGGEAGTTGGGRGGEPIMHEGQCSDQATCGECLSTYDLDSHEMCVFLDPSDPNYQKSGASTQCQTQQFMDMYGIGEDASCQATWGEAMYQSLDGFACDGVRVTTRRASPRTQERCAEQCHATNTPHRRARGLINHAAFADETVAQYCESYEFNRNNRRANRCKFLTKVQPSVADRETCTVAAELADPCAVPRGSWMRHSNGNIYYVSGSLGEIHVARTKLTCFGEDVEAPLDAGAHTRFGELFCDGTQTPDCDKCIESPVRHQRFMGDLTCDDIEVRVARVCQFQTADLSCDQDRVLRILSARYGRFSYNNDIQFCLVPSTETQDTELCLDDDATDADVSSIVRSTCNGKTRCTVDAEDSVFSDQGCATTFKYAEVTYACVAPAVGDSRLVRARHDTDRLV